MKYIMFLEDLCLTRERTRSMLNDVGCGDYEPVWKEDNPGDTIKDQVAIVVTSKHKVGSAQLDPFRAVEMVSLAFTGYNDVDVNYCSNRNISLYFVPNYSTDSVAELATAMAGSLVRRLPTAQRQVESNDWDRAVPGNLDLLPGLQLRGRTVGIIGTGTIGLRTAEVFHYGYRCPLLGWSKTHKAEFIEMGGQYCDTVDEVFSRADIVSLHVQLVNETAHIANRERIGLLRKDSILINCSRTGLVDLSALVEALNEERIFGAAVDITDEEHLRGDLLGLQNLILTPHIGFQTDRALENLASQTIKNIAHFRRKDPTNRLLPKT